VSGEQKAELCETVKPIRGAGSLKCSTDDLMISRLFVIMRSYNRHGIKPFISGNKSITAQILSYIIFVYDISH